jgi:UPF0755 protein
VRMLYNGSQSPVKLSFNKLRTKEDLAAMVGARFECDSADMMRFLSSPDSLKAFGVTPETAMTLVFPDTYTYYWNTTPGRIYRKFVDASGGYWTEPKLAKAKALGLSKAEVITLASIVEEETTYAPDKKLVASVYLNRIRNNDKLQADPTIKFAIRNFALKRVLNIHKDQAVGSPYDTYHVKGLPPGPICTPSRKTIDAVLDAPRTDYYFFVASAKFDGSSVFTRTNAEHEKAAKEYQEELNRRKIF